MLTETQMRFRLMQLRPRERACLLLYHLHKMSFDEIALSLECSTAEVKQCYVRAVMKVAHIPRLPRKWELTIYQLWYRVFA